MNIRKKRICCSFTGEPDPSGISEGLLRDAQKAKTWQEVYKLFDKIVDKYMPDAEKIEKEVYNLYSKNKGLKQYQEAYDHWMDEADLSIENNEEDEKIALKSANSAHEYSNYKSDRRIGVTNQRYKGYMIRLDKSGDGYNVYDKNGELEDSGYLSKESARNFIDELLSTNDEIESAVDMDEETEDPKWVCLDIKHVRDSDGMLTDYALYTTKDEDKYICMFGDTDVYAPDEMYADAEFDTEDEALEWFENYVGPGDEDEDDIYSSEETDADEDNDDLDHPDQEFDSADTSINSSKLPAVYKLISIPKGTVGVDFGGGRFDNAVEHIRDLGATLCVYDPYNRTAQHNREMLRTLKANGGADWAVNSNVLNVIKEQEARQSVLRNISKITKSGAPIYITVYEGRGDAKEGPTKSGYQLNRKTQDYLEEIQEVFPDAKRKGKLIVAHNVKSASSSTNVNSSENIRPIDELNDVTDQLRDDLIQKLIDVMTGPNFGFPRNDVLDYSRVDIGFDDDENSIEVEVGAEVSYDGLMQIAQELDPIIESYDHDAYFDAEDAGLLVAVIPYDSLRKHTDVNSAVDVPEPSLDPPEYDDPEEGEETVEVECDINQLEIKVDEDGSWEYQRDDFLDEMLTAEDEITSEEYDVYIRDRNGLIEDFDSIVEPNIPGVPGTYLISCYVKMVYDVTGVEIVREYQGKDEDGDPIVDEDYYTGNADVEFNRNESYITNFYSEEI